MTISFDDLISLVSDKSRYSRICAVADRYDRAREALAAAQDELERIERELEQLCASHSDDSDRDDDDDRDDDGQYEADDGTMVEMQEAPPRRPRVQRPKPALPGELEGDPRSAAEYVNALDEVGHELGTTGAVAIRSSAVVTAMKNRSFPDRARVMAFLKAHPSWHALPEGHSMFRYAFAPRNMPERTESAEPAAAEG